jgi:GDP-L-fucose synthase
VLLACAHDKVSGPLNLGSEEEIAIGELARLIVELSGLRTKIIFDTSKADGQPRRACNTRRAMETIGFEAAVRLREGLEKTIEWYRREKARRTEHL